MSEDTYLVTRAEIEQLEGAPKAHFLNPNAQCVNKSLGDLTGLTGFGFHIMEVQPGRDTTEPHYHFREDECVYILSGQGVAHIGDEVVSVSEGDFLGYRKGGLAHGLKNTGTGVLRCIVVGERHDTDVVDYPAQHKRMFRTKGLPWNVVDQSDIKDRGR
ncbi:cupin domain-containing protein [Pelagimonas varians]|uniref:Cupin domain protein n=1 Tax=Pelagimonas varians TaxID=696760 RepID=A0A238KEH2_9RHOB|nr:cupin domain-containing protein [Pelagimonas varians]PYG32480.1 putative cupin superfamily protein [Pelagimonas varians]SMX41199.1 Cupin domain protein [Pelagimonas varians]